MDNDATGQYERYMIWSYEVHGARINNFANRLATPNQERAQFVFKDSSGTEIVGAHPVQTTAPFLLLEGTATRHVTLMNNDFRPLSHVVETGKGFDRMELTEFNNLR